MWFLLISAAHAGRDVIAYNTEVVTLMAEFGETLVLVKDLQISANPDEYEHFRQSLRAVTVDYAARFRALPDYDGDATLRDACAAEADMMTQLLDTKFVELGALLRDADVRSEDVLTLDGLLGAVHDTADAAEHQADDAHHAFARRHDYQLLPAEAPTAAGEVPLPTLSLDAITPPGHNLDDGIFVTFTLRYHNQLMADANAMVEAFNTYLEGDGSSMETLRGAKEKVGAARARVAARSDWQGDASLKQAVLTLADNLNALIDQHATPMTQAKAKGFKNNTQVTAYNAHADALNTDYTTAMKAWKATQEAFATRWCFAAYNAWQVDYLAAMEARRAAAMAKSAAQTAEAPAAP